MDFIRSTLGSRTYKEFCLSTLEDAIFRLCTCAVRNAYGANVDSSVELLESLIQNGGNVNAERHDRTLLLAQLNRSVLNKP